jgi:hypothetical protein
MRTLISSVTGGTAGAPAGSRTAARGLAYIPQCAKAGEPCTPGDSLLEGGAFQTEVQQALQKLRIGDAGLLGG